MTLNNYKYENLDGNIFQWCNENNINFDIIEKTSEVLEFNNKAEVESFLRKHENTSQRFKEGKLDFNFIATNSWVGSDVVIHQRRMIDYSLESDNEEILILLYKNDIKVS
jgi:hypothetical protein